MSEAKITLEYDGKIYKKSVDIDYFDTQKACKQIDFLTRSLEYTLKNAVQRMEKTK